MRAMTWWGGRRGAAGLLLLLLTASAASAAFAQDEQGGHFFHKGTFDGMTEAEFKAALPEYFPPADSGRIGVSAIPDVYGPGAVLTVGNLVMKVHNFGGFGNPWTYLSSDPSGQWPGASGVEYLNGVGLAAGAVNPLATDPNAVRRVSYYLEWRPPSLDPEDKIYRAYDGILNGMRFVNDDDDHDPATGEPRIDEDFMDGRDNDLDGLIDEDYAAMGQQTFSYVMRDDTPQAIAAASTEKHVPLGLEARCLAWAYSIPGFTDFNVVQYTFFNRSGHVLDSLYVGGIVDMDCGPVTKSAYWTDDMDLQGFPSGAFPHQTLSSDKRLQDSTMRTVDTPAGVPPDSGLCSHYPIRVNAFSIADDDGDEGQTPGVPTFLLVDHTVDPLGLSGPSRVGFTAFRSYPGGTSYASGGTPRTDHERYEFMSGHANPQIGPDGFISVGKGGDEGGGGTNQKGDYVEWWSCGPWLSLQDGGSVQVTVALLVTREKFDNASQYGSDYAAYVAGSFPGGVSALFAKYPSLANAYAIQVAADGVYEERPDWPWLTNGHGRETPVHPALGEPAITTSDCRDESDRTVTYAGPVDWFDFDCNYCTGVYDSRKKLGMFHRTWNADSPPPNPHLNVAADYNYSDNPSRIAASGDHQVTLAWDNISEVTPDPKSGWLDFRGYRVWKTSDWLRPVGSAGPGDKDWALLGEFRAFHYYTAGRLLERNYAALDSCPKVLVPNHLYPIGSEHCPAGCMDTATVQICLELDDLWDRQSGQVIRKSDVPCVIDANSGECAVVKGCILGRQSCDNELNKETRTRYPVGRYRLVDHEVKNGFIYFYSVTAFDSTGVGRTQLELAGRRSATESEGVIPQGGTMEGKKAWVVPNPYRGYKVIGQRPSSWDLTPNASDPTGTHIDFMGLPRGRWTIKVYTVSGDLVQTIRSTDAVNESIRNPVTLPGGTTVPGYTRQQDNPNDGQASWNLISRNGQDIVSGIYLFTVESDQGIQRGKFVVIR